MAAKTDDRLIVTHGRGRGTTLRIQCAVFGFNTCSFLDLVVSYRSFGTSCDLPKSKLLVLIEPAVFVGQCLLAMLQYISDTFVPIED
jgi:hypothetical protein